MSLDNIGVAGTAGRSPVIHSEKTASTAGSTPQDGSISTLGDQLATLEQQLNALPASPEKDGMQQIHQGLLAAGHSFEKLSGKSFNEVPVPGNSRLDELNARVGQDIDTLMTMARAEPGSSSVTAREASVENLNNALKQSQTSQRMYSQQQAGNGQALQRSMLTATGGPYFPVATIPVNPNEPSPWEPGGDFDMFWGMQQRIGEINTNYIKSYQYIMGGYETPNPPPPAPGPYDPPLPDPAMTPKGGYTQFFKDISAAMNDKVNFLKASNKSGQIIFDYMGFQSHFDNKMAKYMDPAYRIPDPDGVATPPDPTKYTYRYPLTKIPFYKDTTPDQQNKLFEYWTNNLGAGFKVVKEGDGIRVWMNTTVVKEMSMSIRGSFKGDGSDKDMLSQQYSAWETKWNGNQNTVSNIVQRLTDLYSSANRIYDNLVKIMTSAFQSCVDCAKEFLKV